MQQFIKLFIFMSLFGSSSVLGQNTPMSIIGKSYTLGDSSLVIRSLTFINDSICLYKYQFFIDIDSAYRECLIVCEYKTDENKIIINSQEYPDFLNKSRQVSIPNYWDIISKCFIADSVRLYTSTPQKSDEYKFFVLGFLELNYITNGYIDRPINDTLFWFDDCLLYNKSFEVSVSNGNNLSTFYNKHIFINKEHPVSLKQKYSILTSKEANSVFNGLKKNEIKYAIYIHRKHIKHGKIVSDNYIVQKHYQRLRRFFRKYKIDKKEQQNHFYNNYLFWNLN